MCCLWTRDEWKCARIIRTSCRMNAIFSKGFFVYVLNSRSYYYFIFLSNAVPVCLLSYFFPSFILLFDSDRCTTVSSKELRKAISWAVSQGSIVRVSQCVRKPVFIVKFFIALSHNLFLLTTEKKNLVLHKL